MGGLVPSRLRETERKEKRRGTGRRDPPLRVSQSNIHLGPGLAAPRAPSEAHLLPSSYGLSCQLPRPFINFRLSFKTDAFLCRIEQIQGNQIEGSSP